MIEILREYWDWFLFDTLLWTGALIALVMVLRRPVARTFGAGAAYALWFLPLARLFIPPFTLPAWMRPLVEPAADASAGAAPDASTLALPLAETGSSGSTVMTSAVPETDFLTPLLLVWLAGAVFVLVRRFWLYFELRRDLLRSARPVGEIGSIRLIETPSISGPMAFGVLDRVIALPAGFIASRNREARDLAIAHEIAHHRGGDLIVNMLVQPLFAIHWFNPLGHLGWNALRRDQEAYCDARVVAARSLEERATYASVIADFARLPALAPKPALAAPMACPVLGDKSIIHRLRSLSMSDVSPRRRLTGRAAIAGAFLAVPLTASVCYADGVPNALIASAAAAESAVATSQKRVVEEKIVEREVEGSHHDAGDDHHEVIEVERKTDDGRVHRIEKRHIRIPAEKWDRMSEEERAKYRAEMAELRAKFAEGGEMQMEMEKLRREFAEDGDTRRQIRLAVAEAHKAGEMAPEVVISCKDKQSPVTSETDANGKTTLFVCETAADKIALRAMKKARGAIAADTSLSAAERAEALRSLDAKIAEAEKN